jgi:subtilisin family serine protease
MKLLCYCCLVLLSLGGTLRADYIPNDTFYNSHQWYAPLIGLPQAWDYSTGSHSVKIAVIDMGVITTTPDLFGRVDSPLAITGSSVVSNSVLALTAAGRHGTNVTSVAAMSINNMNGGAGIGNFQILPITVPVGSGNPTPAKVAEAIRLAADNGAKVIICSLSVLSYGLANDAATYAREKGALVFFAAGNTNSFTSQVPYSDLIFVTGSNRTDQRWVGTNGAGSTWGAHVNLVAPAQDIVVANPASATGNEFGIGSGTSFAAPIAGGIAALAWSINPNLTPDQVRQMLYDSAVDLPGDISTGLPDNWDGHGRVNAAGVASLAFASIPEPGVWALGIELLTLSAFVWHRRQKKSHAAQCH